MCHAIPRPVTGPSFGPPSRGFVPVTPHTAVADAIASATGHPSDVPSWLMDAGSPERNSTATWLGGTPVAGSIGQDDAGVPAEGTRANSVGSYDVPPRDTPMAAVDVHPFVKKTTKHGGNAY
jgi:hypothetical protein